MRHRRGRAPSDSPHALDPSLQAKLLHSPVTDRPSASMGKTPRRRARGDFDRALDGCLCGAFSRGGTL